MIVDVVVDLVFGKGVVKESIILSRLVSEDLFNSRDDHFLVKLRYRVFVPRDRVYGLNYKVNGVHHRVVGLTGVELGDLRVGKVPDVIGFDLFEEEVEKLRDTREQVANEKSRERIVLRGKIKRARRDGEIKIFEII